MRVKSIRVFRLFLVITFLSSLIPSTNVTQRVTAQSLSSAISGRVTDGNSIGIQGVTIMALQINYQIMLPIVMGGSTTSTPTIPPINSSGTEQNYYTVLTDSSGNYDLSGLPTGRYQLSAFKEGEDFNPISYTVLSSDAGGPYDFQTTIIPTVYSPQTKVLSQDALSKLISVSEDEITYTFSPQTSELAQVTVGDIILGGTTHLSPEGFLRRVTSIQTVDGQLTFTTEQAALEEAFESLSVHGMQDLDTSVIPVTSSVPGIQLSSAPAIEGFGDFNREFNNAVLYDHDGDLSTKGDQIVANGIFSLMKPVIEARIRIENFKLEELYYSSTTTLQTSFTVSSKIKLSVPLTEVHLLPEPFPLGVYQLGPLPLEPTFDMVASISGSVSAGFTSKINNTSTTTAGFWLLNDNIQYPKKTESNFSTDDNNWDWGFTDKVTFKASIGPKVAVSIYKAISGYVTPSVGFKLEIAPEENPYLKLYGVFDAAVGFSVEVPIIKKDLVKWDVIAIEKSWLLYSLSRFTDNTQPDAAQNPSPQIGAVGQSLSATLSWSGSDPDGDMLVYDVYLDPENSYPTTKIADHQIATSISTGTLTPNSTYYWKVVTFDEHGASTASPVWYFKTVAGDTTLVSVASDGALGNDDSGVYWGYISGNGRFVAFGSHASNLVDGDTNGKGDVFIHDRQTRETRIVSVASDGTQGNSSSVNAVAISDDGRYVAFSSWASNLVPNDTNEAQDVFVHDMQNGQTQIVSISSGGTLGNNDSGYSIISISDDGRYVAFYSSSSNLVSDDTNGFSDVFIHDRQTRETRIVSVASDGTQGNGESYNGNISPDGRYVVFSSSASNLVSNDTNATSDAFLYDLQTAQTTRISVSSNGTQGNNSSYGGDISENGRYVMFYSDASNLVPGDTNGKSDIFVHDNQTGQTTRVSVASDGTQANDHNRDGCGAVASISSDGRFVVFTSSASNLVPGDINGYNDVFVNDNQTRQTTRISLAFDGSQTNGNSGYCRNPTISSDGSLVAFVSAASNLVSGDVNGYWDVFVYEREINPAANSTSGRVTDGSSKGIAGVSISDGAGHIAIIDSNGD